LKLHAFAHECLPNLPIREKTLSNYKSMYKCHIENKLGDRFLEEITRADIQNVIRQLPSQTAATTLAVCKTIFREAISHGLISDSPATGVRSTAIQVVPRKFLAVQELEELNLGKYRSQILFLGYHGLRWGEAVALTEADIVDGKIHVNKSIHGATKTRAGIRVIPQVVDYKKFSASPKGMRNVLHKHGVHIHPLRDTYAYLLKSSGVHVTTAQRLMGHSDPGITLGIYTRFRDDEIDQAGEMIRSFRGLEKI
jgi:integrase